MTFRTARIAAASTALLLLAGCVPTGAEPTPEPTSAAPSVAPEPAVAESIVVGGTSLTIVFDDGTTSVFAYADDPDVTIAALTSALGAEPVVEQLPEGNCVASRVSSTWDGVQVFTESELLPPGQLLSVYVDGEPALPVSASDGSTLGEDNSAQFTATDEAFAASSMYEGEKSTFIYFDVQNLGPSGVLYSDRGPEPGADGNPAWGGYIYAKDDIVTRISAPTYYGDC